MRHPGMFMRRGARAAASISGGMLLGCTAMSESLSDDAAGFNGGFEVARDGLPVNWIVYSPRTIPTGDYDLVVDQENFKEGRQSLRFVVRESSPDGGNRSPGISKEHPATPGHRYKVGFWVRNDGAEFRARVGSVTATEGVYDLIVQSKDTIPTWRYYEHELTLPSESDRIRFEVNVLGPGEFWIDDISISEVG